MPAPHRDLAPGPFVCTQRILRTAHRCITTPTRSACRAGVICGFHPVQRIEGGRAAAHADSCAEQSRAGVARGVRGAKPLRGGVWGVPPPEDTTGAPGPRFPRT